jgi:hypothetical protein
LVERAILPAPRGFSNFAGVHDMKRLAFRAVAAAMVLCGFVATARADFVIYSDLGPGQSYGPGYYSIAGAGGAQYGGAAQAQSFTPTDNFVFTQVLVALTYFQGTNLFTISLMSDESGHPGTTLESFSATGVAEYPSATLETFTSATNTMLTKGTTYWIGVFPGEIDLAGGWVINSTGATGYSRVGNAHGDGTQNWASYAGPSAAFEVRGVPVPEPASLAMLGTGAIILIGCAWWRRQPKRFE